jgi:hypothetical protein
MSPMAIAGPLRPAESRVRLPANALAAGPGQAGVLDQPLDQESLDRDEDTAAGDARHDAAERVAEVVGLQELEDEELAQLAFRRLRLVLGLGAVASQLDEPPLIQDAVVGGHTSSQLAPLAPAGRPPAVLGRVQVRLQRPVDGEVRVAPDRAREMGVVLRGQGEVANERRAVGCRRQRAQDPEVDRP